MAPTSGGSTSVIIDNLNLGILAGEVSDVPGNPLQMWTILAGRAANYLAVYHQVDRGFG